MPPFTVYVLCYGDHPKLAQRCLTSVIAAATPDYVERIVVLGNELSEESERVVDLICLAAKVPVVVLLDARNAGKYPAMLAAFTGLSHHGVAPLSTEFAMWFDDDSFIRQSATPAFFSQAAAAATDYDMVGQPYTIQLRGGQADWIKSQPWYTGLAVPQSPSFFTGGWWILRSSVIRKYNWPILELQHRGGDVMLGVLCQQQGLRMNTWHAGVAINADDAGQNALSEPRGISSTARPIGVDFRR